ncbi:metallophosphoesterase [Mesobacillus harenae]|uniref:metallophosphoesterase n=1 Tax=Mesobacillus harenae TaxID=2213203 RepID=UPI00157FCE91|nr:metallophosphoesterase [Mesobacillus harenae]
MVIFLLVFLGIAVGMLVHMYKEAQTDRVIINKLFFSDFPKSFGEVTIFFISDIHHRKVSQQIIEQVKGKADLIVIGGDLAEKGVSMSRIKENLLKLKDLGPVYFVWGNNDYETDSHELDALLLDLGIKILDNTAVKFESDSGEELVMLGVDDVGLERDRLDLALADAGDNGFRVLISHNPVIFKKIDQNNRIRLVISGHTHGGQIRIFGFGPYELGGIKEHGNTTVLTSNGYGTTKIPLRLGAPAQTHLITLSHSERRES